MAVDRKELTVQVGPRMGFDEREMMMLYLLRHPGIFLEAKELLSPDLFTEPYEIVWAVSWRSAIDLYDQFGEMPGLAVLEADALSRIEALPDGMPPSVIDEMREFLAAIFGTDDSVLNGAYENYGYELLKKFLNERFLADHVRSQLQGSGSAVPVNLPSLFQDYNNRIMQVGGVQVSVMDNLMPDQWEPTGVVRNSTCLDFFDKPMGGGWVDEEVYGILGPFGAGKTMLACQLAGEIASSFVEQSVKTGKPPRHTFFFTYEMSPDEIRRRIIAHLAGVNLNHLANVPWTSSLTRTGRRHPYEEELFSEDPFGEYERVEAVRSISDTFHIADMRGSRRAPKAGSGWVDEIHAEIEKKLRRLHHRFDVGQVFIDYALICSRRYIKARGWDEDRKLRHLVGTFGDECRRLISDHFKCGTWILNQLSGEANRKSSGSILRSADSAEARNFAENLHYSFVLGNKDREHNCISFNCDKTRRSEGSTGPSILRLRGELARFELADDRYMVDSAVGKIIPKQLGKMVPERVSRVRPPARHAPGGGPAYDGV